MEAFEAASLFPPVKDIESSLNAIALASNANTTVHYMDGKKSDENASR